jgi:hypothetical protein
MATNPRVPDDSERQRIYKVEPLTPPEPPRRAWGGVIVAIVLAAILLAMFYKMLQAPTANPTPSAATVPDQPTGSAIQIQSLQMTPSPDGNSMTLQGQLMNAGQQTLTGVNMNVSFRGRDGRVLSAAAYPVDVLDVSGRGAGARGSGEKPLGIEPSKPNDLRSFRVRVDRVPQGWNHQMPDVSIAEVTSHP